MRSEFALIAKRDRDSSTCVGDMLMVKGQTSPSHQYADTTRWDEGFHSGTTSSHQHRESRVEALIVDDTAAKTDFTNREFLRSTGNVTDLRLENADGAKTGDLVTDLDSSARRAGGIRSRAERRAEFYTSTSYTSDTSFPTDFWKGDMLAYDLYSESSALNFSTEHIVWKRRWTAAICRCHPSTLGASVPCWTTRVAGNTTCKRWRVTRSLSPGPRDHQRRHDASAAGAGTLAQLAERHQETIGGVLTIPNEEMQFDEVVVVDDSGRARLRTRKPT